MDLVFEWWVWAVAALVLGILEILAPAFVLLGFAIGAGVIAVLLLIGGPALVGGSIAMALVIFASVSLIAWLVLRKVFALKTGQVKTFDTDINQG
ncbi:NfeD family protein [Cognatishimia sp. MH4019]|uniref:NfeD family protein n=1 Tax=Cognatishimia sp. MH4019 TaxID=2854030 RepID=UPI001CD7E373|nr:hypothetical protein [Cognatishimia sp. MH4019]